MYDYKCEYCTGTVKERLMGKEVFKYKKGFIMLENVPVGVCDNCKHRYYHASIIKQLDNVAEGNQQDIKIEKIPVGKYIYEVAS